jgi:hypothetical protein
MADRAQTNQDFVVGISIFLLTVAGVIAFVPVVFQPFEDPTQASEYTQANELADTILEEKRIGGTANTLDYHELESYLAPSSDISAELRADAGITLHNANVTITDGKITSGTIYDDPVLKTGSDVFLSTQSTATVTRIVRFDNETRCTGTCRLVVRVW